jgi:hypothetical protein
LCVVGRSRRKRQRARLSAPGEEPARLQTSHGKGDRAAGDDVEVTRALEERLVVIAQQHDIAARAHDVDAVLGLRSVADHVPEADHLADAALRIDVREDGVERLAVAVDVGDDRDQPGRSRRADSASGR